MAQVFVPLMIYLFYFLLLFTFIKTNPIVPLPPTNLQLTQKTSTSASISWTASAGSGVYKIVLSSVTKQTNYLQTSLKLSSLTPSIYTVTVYSGKYPISAYETVGIFYLFIYFLLITITKVKKKKFKGISIQFQICARGYDGVNCDRKILIFFFFS